MNQHALHKINLSVSRISFVRDESEVPLNPTEGGSFTPIAPCTFTTPRRPVAFTVNKGPVNWSPRVGQSVSQSAGKCGWVGEFLLRR